MPVLTSTIRRVRRSGNNVALTQNRWATWPWGRTTVTGTAVNDDTAMGLPAIYRALQLVSMTLGGLPIQVFHEDIAANGGEGETIRLKAPDTAYLWMEPNTEQTKQTFWSRIFGDVLRGNAFIWVEKDGRGLPLAIWHIDRNRVRVGRTESLQKVYEVDNELPMIDYREGGEIVHIPNWGRDIVGFDPLAVASEAIALGLSAQEFAARSVDEGEIPPGILKTEQKLTPDQSEEISLRWSAQRGGVRNQNKIKVLGSGAEFQKISVDPETMQLESLRKFQRNEIATLFGLPPFLLGDMDHASQGGGNGLEEQNRMLIQFNFQGLINAVEQAVTSALLVRELTNRYMRFNLEGLLRGTTLQRYQALRMADFLTINEKRAIEDLPPIEGGDELLVMTNMAPLDDLEKIALGGKG